MFIFGYGSLIWNPGFAYEAKVVGCVRGYSRRFWQGSEEHRGVPGKPGRVAVLVPSADADEEVWGVAFKVAKENADEALRYLSARESGYALLPVTLYAVGGGRRRTLEVSVFVALKDSPSYLGPAPIQEIARTIYQSEGKCGTNLEYFVKLVESLREILPRDVLARDRHLVELQHEIGKLSAATRQEAATMATMLASEE